MYLPIVTDVISEVFARGLVDGPESVTITQPDEGETLSKIEFSDGSRIEVDRSTEVFDEEGEPLFVVTVVSKGGTTHTLEPTIAYSASYLVKAYESVVSRVEVL